MIFVYIVFLSNHYRHQSFIVRICGLILTGQMTILRESGGIEVDRFIRKQAWPQPQRGWKLQWILTILDLIISKPVMEYPDIPNNIYI